MQWRDVFFKQYADKVAPGSIAADGDGGWRSVLWQGA
jgi:hypothetical protein